MRAGLVARPEDWLYSSAGNYLNGKGILDMPLFWSEFATDGSWFFGNMDFPLLNWVFSEAWTVLVVRKGGVCAVGNAHGDRPREAQPARERSIGTYQDARY